MEDRYVESHDYILESQNVIRDSRSQSNILEAQKRVWWAMSAPYQRELKAKAELESKGIENFIPMRYQAVKKRDGSMARELLPAIHNLIFVRGSRPEIQSVKQGVLYLQWLTRPMDGKNVPLTVPDRDMERFIEVTETFNEHLIYLRPEEVDLQKGTPVRILGGQFNGMEGTFVKVRGARKKRVVVMLKGIIGVALAEVTPDLLEVL